MPKTKTTWKKGRPGPGRGKGTPNKFTTLKQAFLDAFLNIGGTETLAKFAKGKHKPEFYKMVASMLPKDVQLSGPEGAPLIPPTIEVKFVTPNGEPTKPIEPKPISSDGVPPV
jgi:hypothetical protein